ncbi:MAG: hypothetical protein CMH98_03735 [Oceanospirillaceae bacterium]|nr:hypothetical protein [Oceanospirillaceae bacterium]
MSEGQLARALSQYIDDEFGGSQMDFARAQGVEKQQVQKWLKRMDVVVVGNKLYSYRRDLNSTPIGDDQNKK